MPPMIKITQEPLAQIIDELRGQIAQLQAKNAKSNNSTPPQMIQMTQQPINQEQSFKIPHPEAFTGDNSTTADEWTFQMSQYHKLAKVPTEMQVPLSASLLRGTASLWWRGKIALMEGREFTWEQ